VKVVIPAAGLGKRFAGAGFDVPKELLPLGGRPVIGHALWEAARAGFEAAIVVLSLRKPGLRKFLSENRTPLPVEFIIQPEALGIGDAVLRCWSGKALGVLLPDDVVLGVQHWSKLNELHREEGSACLCVREVPLAQTSRFGIAECVGDRVVGLVEKPKPGESSSNLAIFGRYIVTQPVVDGLRGLPLKGEIELTDGFAAALPFRPGIRAHHFEGDIFDCGTPEAYARSTARFPLRTVD